MNLTVVSLGRESSDPSDLPLSLISNLKYPGKTIKIRVITVNWYVQVLHGDESVPSNHLGFALLQ